MLNQCTFYGRLTKDPIHNVTLSGKSYAFFTIAVERDFKNKNEERPKTDFIKCQAWAGTADFLSKYFHKGDAVIVSGHLQNNEETTKEGNKYQGMIVVAENIYFGESKKKNNDSDTSDTNDNPPADNNEEFSELDDEELPF